MQLKNDSQSHNIFREIILEYYENLPLRCAKYFLNSKNEDWCYQHFLIDHKHVIRCCIGQDRNLWLISIELGIGPHYFSPRDFWSSEHSNRFKLDANTASVIHNLALLDEFLGYPEPLKHAYGWKPTL